MSQDTFIAQRIMFSFAAGDAFAPSLKRTRGDVAAHDLYYLIFRHLKLRLYSLERRAVLPRHFYNAADLALG